MRDMVQKGRARSGDHSGEKHPQSKLTESDVKHICECSESTSNLSKRYSVSRATICNIKKGTSWKCVDVERRKFHGNARLSDEQVLSIRESNEKGRLLANKYSVSETTISEIRNGRKHRKLI